MQQQTPPVEQGEEFDITIEAVGEKGDGIAKKKGFVLFVPNTKAGEHCRVRVTKVLTKVGFAEKIGEALNPPKPKKEYGPVVKPMERVQIEDTEDFGEEPDEEDTSKNSETQKCEKCGGTMEEGHTCPAQGPTKEENSTESEDDLDDDIPPPPN